MKNYVKPELFYERYEVSQHIADCAWEWEKSGTDPNNCKAMPDPKKLPGMPTIFLDEAIGCIFTEVKEYENYCYQNSADGIKLHMS